MSTRSVIRLAIVVLALFTLPTCGGGGGGGKAGPTVGLKAGFNKAMGFNGTVRAIAPAADGSGDVYVGGDFTSYNRTEVGRLARVNSDGTLDTTFGIGNGFSGPVYSIAPATDGSGDVYVGGDFTSYNGIEVGRLARLNSDSTLDTAFRVGSGFDSGTVFKGVVYSIAPAVDGSGDVYVGGSVISYKGTAVNRLARLNSDGTLDTAFAVGAGFDIVGASLDGFVLSIATAADGSGDVYVGGNFTSYNGSTAIRLARLNSDGTLDTAFVAGTGFDGSVRSIVSAADGSGDVYVGGDFGSYKGTTVNEVARLNSDGTLDTAFAIGTGFDGGVAFRGTVYSVVSAADGSDDVYVGGDFSSFNGTAINGMARLNSDGTLDTAFAIGTGFDGGAAFRGPAFGIAPAADGSGDVYVGGDFTSYNGTAVNRLARLNSDGTLDATSTIGAGFNREVRNITPAADGSGDVYVGGNFTNYNGTAVNGLVRLYSDGTLDTAFATGSGFNVSLFGKRVYSIAMAADGSGDVYVGGDFTSYNGTAVGRVVRLNNDGTLDTAFATGSGFSDRVNSIAPAADGSGDVYVGGEFFSYDGSAVNRLARLNSDGTLDTAFATGSGFGGPVSIVVPAADGSGDVYVGGRLVNYNGTTVSGLVRLNSDGTLDTGFAVGTDFHDPVDAMAAARDGSGDVYVSISLGLTLKPVVARFNSNGTLDTAFAVWSGFSNQVNSIVPTTDGSGDVYIGADRLVRLNRDGALDAAFDIGSGFGDLSPFVYSMALAEDGSGDLLVGGSFSSFQMTTTDTVIRLDLSRTFN